MTLKEHKKLLEILDKFIDDDITSFPRVQISAPIEMKRPDDSSVDKEEIFVQWFNEHWQLVLKMDPMSAAFRIARKAYQKGLSEKAMQESQQEKSNQNE